MKVMVTHVLCFQVASHLLSEKEKNEMSQLVKTMVSYSITYRNKKIDPLPGKLNNEVTMDASVFSFDPPIGDFVNFEVSVHFT